MKTNTLVAAGLISMAGGLAIAACQTSDVQQSALYGCTTATFALRGATASFDQLSAAQKTTINEARVTIDPICRSPEIPTLDVAARAAFEAALTRLVAATSK